jgi:hypothetical protein
MTYKLPKFITYRDVELTQYNIVVRIEMMTNQELDTFQRWYKQVSEGKIDNYLQEFQAILNTRIEGVYSLDTDEKLDDSIDLSDASQTDLALMINALITPTEKEIEDAQKKMTQINKITRAKR